MNAIDKVCEKYPDLTGFGFGGKGNIDPTEVQTCIEWLLAHDALDRRKTINTGRTSYSWKHVVEREKDKYISNGAFICAALYLGYKMKRVNDGSPNAFFNIRNKNAIRK
jgi:hypothetical protein